MWASLVDPVGASKKNDNRPIQIDHILFRCIIILAILSAIFVCAAYFYGRRSGKVDAAANRRSSIEFDEEGNEICHVPTIRRAEEFFDDIELTTADCRSAVQLGKTAIAEVMHEEWGMGTRCNESAAHFQWVCLDKRLNIDHRSCLVYSVGVDAEFSFEVDMEKFGCDVFAFDTEHYSADFKHSGRIWFQNIRIGATSYDAFKEGDKVEKVRSLHHVVEKLGHQDRKIDVLKLDVRDHEWQALDEFVHSEVMDQVKQLVVTLTFSHAHHTADGKQLMEKLLQHYQLLRMLDCDGFRVFSSVGRGEKQRTHDMKRPFYPEYEISYINTNFFK